MRILVTGATGVIGRQCLPLLLAAGHDVHAAARHTAGISGATCHSVDLLSPGVPTSLISGVRPATVLHLAWCTTPGEYWSSPENLRWIEASLELLRCSASAGCRRFVVAGTSAETHGPASLYGTSKSAAHSVLQAFARQSGMTWCWGRIFNVYGPHEDSRRLVPSIIAALQNETSISITSEVRDFLYVKDVARALVRLVENDFSGATDIGSGEAVRIEEIAGIVAGILGKQPLPVPGRSSDSTVVQAQIDVLKREIGWKPAYTLLSGLRETVEWWQNR